MSIKSAPYRLHYHMTRHLYWYIFGIISAILIIILILGEIYWPTKTWIFNAISLICGLSSLAGVILALIQIQQADTQIKTLSNNTAEINKAVMAYRKEVKEFLSYAELGKLRGLIQTTQDCIRNNDYGSSVFLLQNIKDDLYSVDNQFEDWLRKENVIMSKTISKVTSDIDTLSTHIIKMRRNEESTIILEHIHSHLEQARGIIIRIENKLKKKKL